MTLTYQEFINNVPKETVDYVNKSLRLINHFVVLKKEKLSTISNINAKISCILILLKYQLDSDNLTRIFLDKYKIRKDYEFALFDVDKFFEDEDENIKYEEIFSKFAHIFCVYDSLEQYTLLTPERIILKNGDSFHSDIVKIFDSQFSISDFYEKYNEIVINLEKQNLNSFKDELYKDLSSDLIIFLEKCAEIYHYFDKKVIFDENDSDDFVVMSFINAIFTSINTLDVVKYFQSVGIDYDAIKRAFNFNYFETSDLFIGFDKSLIINKYFKKYLFEGVNKNISKEQLSIVKIMGNVFDRNFTNSLKFENLLNSCGVSIDKFDNFEADFDLFIKSEEIKKNKEAKDEFFKDMSFDVVEFIEFLSKIYIILDDNFNINKINEKIIKNEEDIKTLTLFLSSYFFDNIYNAYFSDNGITYDKIMELLYLNITKGEIDNQIFDLSIAEKFKQFFKPNNFLYNYNKCIEVNSSLTIDSILSCIGDKNNTNRSNCIEKLMKLINPELYTWSNFDDFKLLINNYNKQKEDLRIFDETNNFFESMNDETISFIKLVYKCYRFLDQVKGEKDLVRDDLIQISILTTLLNCYANEEELFVSTLIRENPLLKFNYALNKKDISDRFNEFDINIDIIKKRFSKYIFEGKNKGKLKSEIMISDICKNIFNRELNNSINLISFLDSIGFNFKKFENYDVEKEKFLKGLKISEIQSIIKPSALNYFDNLAKIYENLSNIFDKNEVDDDMIKNHSLILSLFLGYVGIDNRLCLLNKRGISLESYLNFIKIDIGEFNEYKNIKADYEIIGEKFEDYYTLRYGLGESQIISVMKKIFAKDENGCYKYSDYFESLNQDSALISDEINLGEEIIIPLSLDEQVNYFSNLPIGKLDYDIVNISSFGRELADHSNVIAQESLKLASLDDSELVCDIQDEFNKLNQKPKFSLFNRKVNNELKIEKNKNILNDLNKFLEQKEAKMIEEVKKFCHLKKLIAIYIYRLNGYIMELENAIKNIENNQFENNSILFENLDIQVVKQILYSKLEDFKKSLIINTQEYQKINLMLGSHAMTISKISTVRNTTLPNLYIEMSIQDGLITEQESIQSLNDINGLLDNMINTNEELLRNNLKVKNSLKNSNIVITDEMNASINSILVGEHIIENDVNKQKKLIK